ncbi:hypothetical protein GC177_08825 [bacterium]|nr:hypothetical protein [bacterium]
MSDVTASETRQVYDALARRANTGAAGLPLFADCMPDLRQIAGAAPQIANLSIPLPPSGLRANDYMHQLVDMARNASPDQAEAYHFYLREAALLVNAELLTAYPDAQSRPADVQAVIDLNKRLMDEYLPHVREELDLAEDQQAFGLLEPLWMAEQVVDLPFDMPLPDAKEAIARFADALGDRLKEPAFAALRETLEQQLGIQDATMIPEFLRGMMDTIGDMPLSGESADTLTQAFDWMESISEDIADLPPEEMAAFQDILDLASEMGLLDDGVSMPSIDMDMPMPEGEAITTTDGAEVTETAEPETDNAAVLASDIAAQLSPEVTALLQAVGILPQPMASSLGVSENFSPDASQAQGAKPDMPTPSLR